MRKKVTVVGGGFVGSTTAQRIVDLELADVVLTDILDGPPAGKALDMVESTPITRTDAHVTGISTATGDYRETANSDIVVGSATTCPSICSRWLRPKRVKSGMLSESVAQKPTIAVTLGANTFQNAPVVAK